jgi:MFS family permease
MARSSLAPILISAGILLAGNGLQVTLVAVRANQEGFSAALIGLLGTAYYVGFIAGCFLSAGLIRRAGHIRVFASLAALAAVAALCLVLVVDPWVWTILRGLTGFCFSGLAMVLESWLNEKAGASDRGRVLSIYRVVDLGAVLGSQMLLPIFGSGGFQVFAVVAIFFCLAVVPMSLSRHEGPAVPESRRLRLSNIWRISPVGCVGCFTIGLTNAAFRTVPGSLAGRWRSIRWVCFRTASTDAWS